MKPPKTSDSKSTLVNILTAMRCKRGHICIVFLSILLAGCGNSPESARKSLTKLGKDFTPATFFECVGNGDKEAVRLFIAAGIDVNTQAGEGMTALNYYAMKGDAEMVKLLLGKGANPNAAMTEGNTKGMTPMMSAALGGHVEVVKLLLTKGADVHAKDAQGLGSVDYAGTNQAILEPLWQRGAPVQTTLAVKMLLDKFHQDLRGKVIQSMSNKQSPDAARKLVDEQLAKYRDRLKFTPDQLLQARIKAFNTVWDALDAFRLNGVSSMETETSQSIKPFLDFLKELQADSVVQRELLLSAASSGEQGTLKWLLAQRADVNVKNENGLTPLIFTAAKGHLKAAQALIDAGADVNLKGYKGWTATMFAASQGKIEVLKILLAKKPDVNAANDDGQTALALAREKGQTEAVVMLKDAGAKE